MNWYKQAISWNNVPSDQQEEQQSFIPQSRLDWQPKQPARSEQEQAETNELLEMSKELPDIDEEAEQMAKELFDHFKPKVEEIVSRYYKQLASDPNGTEIIADKIMKYIFDQEPALSDPMQADPIQADPMMVGIFQADIFRYVVAVMRQLGGGGGSEEFSDLDIG